MAYYRTSADRKAEAARTRQITEESIKGKTMWYTVLSSTFYDTMALRAGNVFQCSKMIGGSIALCKVDADGNVISNVPCLVVTPDAARKYFSKPTKSFKDAMEQSFMVSEAAYC